MKNLDASGDLLLAGLHIAVSQQASPGVRLKLSTGQLSLFVEGPLFFRLFFLQPAFCYSPGPTLASRAGIMLNPFSFAARGCCIVLVGQNFNWG